MSLKDKLRQQGGSGGAPQIFTKFGVAGNPFPSANQTSNNPHFRTDADEEAEARILSFIRDNRSQVVVVEGTQGTGKTNFLNYFEGQIQEALEEEDEYYVVRYLADPEASFEATIRRLFQEIGTNHLEKLAAKLADDASPMTVVRSQDMQAALHALRDEDTRGANAALMLEWLLGFRLLKIHRETLGVQFRLDTVESKTAALRDLILVSSKAEVLKGIFLLLDELEKQDGVLGPTAITRYLSAMRAIIDALPRHLFMMIAITPDALRRYSAAVPAFRSRLQNQITLPPLEQFGAASKLADFYLTTAKTEASNRQQFRGQIAGRQELVTNEDIEEIFDGLRKAAERRGDSGIRQREFLHQLHVLAEERLQQA